MKFKKMAGLIIILAISGIFWTNYSSFTTASELIAKLQNHGIYYKPQQTEEGNIIPATVFINDEKVVTFNQVAGGLTPRQRAHALVVKLRNFVKEEKCPWNIFPGFENGIAVIKTDDEILFTADVKSAEVEGLSVSDLALAWANSVRRALGATELIRDFELFKVLGKNYDKNVGHREVGVASWYGPYFHGRTAADGSTYNMYQFTAAHKTLPFGSIVKVTNLKNGEACLVKITDRGPFIGKRIIDLSRVAAEEIGMLHKGISEVEIEVIGRV